jgi:hypothetical protein
MGLIDLFYRILVGMHIMYSTLDANTSILVSFLTLGMQDFHHLEFGASGS